MAGSAGAWTSWPCRPHPGILLGHPASPRLRGAGSASVTGVTHCTPEDGPYPADCTAARPGRVTWGPGFHPLPTPQRRQNLHPWDLHTLGARASLSQRRVGWQSRADPRGRTSVVFNLGFLVSKLRVRAESSLFLRCANNLP